MKKLLVLLTLAAFVICVPLAMAADTSAGAKAGLGGQHAQVNCCIKGKCTKVGSTADCAKQMGKVVKDCKACK
jgi:Spy/CpxP family protein refolding chaperone